MRHNSAAEIPLVLAEEGEVKDTLRSLIVRANLHVHKGNYIDVVAFLDAALAIAQKQAAQPR